MLKDQALILEILIIKKNRHLWAKKTIIIIVHHKITQIAGIIKANRKIIVHHGWEARKVKAFMDKSMINIRNKNILIEHIQLLKMWDVNEPSYNKIFLN